MPLPENHAVWPPLSIAAPTAKFAEWAAWYSGDPDRIIDANAHVAGAPWWKFWHRARESYDGMQRSQLHVPVASDLAGVSASLLFGEPPKIRIRPAHSEHEEDVDTESPDDALTEEDLTPRHQLTPEQEAEKRVLQMMEEGDVYARLVEAAETSAAMGGVYIYPYWDVDLRPFPLMAIAQSDQAVPEFRHGFLTAVTFHRVVRAEGNTLLRHLERHEVEGTGESRKAVILHGMYQGNQTSLGVRVALQQDLVGPLAPRIELPFKELDVEYVPNIRPNRLWRGSGLGVPDIQGSEGLLDAVDEVYTSWMRDIRLAKARIIVPREYLRIDEQDGNAAFDLDQEIYTPMEMEPGLTQDSRAMLAHQFDIRFEEHRETARDFIQRIVSNAGYTPTTGEAETGTALRISEHKTILTLRRKSGWWRTAIANCLYHMMQIDQEIFGQKYPLIRPTVITADSIIDNPLELAQTAMALKTAESASIETRVRLIHPDWSTEEVEAEVARIKDQVKAAQPAPAFGRGSFGNPDDDPASTDKKPTTEQPTGPAPTNAPPPQVPKQ